MNRRASTVLALLLLAPLLFLTLGTPLRASASVGSCSSSSESDIAVLTLYALVEENSAYATATYMAAGPYPVWVVVSLATDSGYTWSWSDGCGSATASTSQTGGSYHFAAASAQGFILGVKNSELETSCTAFIDRASCS